MLQRLLPFGEVISRCCHSLSSNRCNCLAYTNTSWASVVSQRSQTPSLLDVPLPVCLSLLLPKAPFSFRISGSFWSYSGVLLFYMYMGEFHGLCATFSYCGARQKSQDTRVVACLPSEHWAGLVALLWEAGTWQWSSRAIAMESGFQLGFLVFCHMLFGSQVDKQEQGVIWLISDQALWKVLDSENWSFWKAHK